MDHYTREFETHSIWSMESNRVLSCLIMHYSTKLQRGIATTGSAIEALTWVAPSANHGPHKGTMPSGVLGFLPFWLLHFSLLLAHQSIPWWRFLWLFQKLIPRALCFFRSCIWLLRHAQTLWNCGSSNRIGMILNRNWIVNCSHFNDGQGVGPCRY